jgi:L-phenylalanine/L-methionine N-acetyltransferase
MHKTPDVKAPASRLIVRRAIAEDADAVATFAAEASVVQGTLQMPFSDAPLWRQRINDTDPANLALVAVLEATPIGFASLRKLNNSPRQAHVRALGVLVASQAQGQGVGSALLHDLIDWADNWAQVRRIELRVNVDNFHAIALYQKCGFVEEGRLRGECFRAGKYVDVLAMARWRDAPM